MTDPRHEETAREIVGPCSCSPSYLAIKRGDGHKPDPGCAWCSFGLDIASAIRAAVEVERERCAGIVKCQWWPLLSDHEDVRWQIAAAIRAHPEPVQPKRLDGRYVEAGDGGVAHEEAENVSAHPREQAAHPVTPGGSGSSPDHRPSAPSAGGSGISAASPACPDPQPSGVRTGTATEACATCGGTGYVINESNNGARSCPACRPGGGT